MVLARTSLLRTGYLHKNAAYITTIIKWLRGKFMPCIPLRLAEATNIARLPAVSATKTTLICARHTARRASSFQIPA